MKNWSFDELSEVVEDHSIRIEFTESKLSEGWTNSFQATEIGKLTSRISDLMGRVSELEKKKEEPLHYSSALPSIVVNHDELAKAIKIESAVVENLLIIQQAAKSLLTYLKEQDAISVPLLNSLWQALGNDKTLFWFETDKIKIHE